MKNIHTPILQIMRHYAIVLDDQDILRILEKLVVEQESEALALLAFLDRMCDRMKPDIQAGVHLLAEPLASSDAEKICMTVQDYLEDNGYGYLISGEEG